MTHGHEVLEMMFGKSYASCEELVNAIINKFGAEERFYTCSAENMTVVLVWLIIVRWAICLDA